MEQFFLAGITVKQLLEQIGEVIETKISAAIPAFSQSNRQKYISRAEVAKLLRVSLPTLGEYVKLGWLKPYKIGRRVLFKQDEIEESLNKLISLKYKRGGSYD